MKTLIALLTMLQLTSPQGKSMQIVQPDDKFNHQDKLVIEFVIGECMDDKGNGKILNTENDEYNYIHYSGDIGKGDVVETYLIYNPENNACDDIIMRQDFIIDKGNLNNR